MGFMKELEFEEAAALQMAKPWKDVPVAVLYRIESITKIDTKNGSSTILGLRDSEDKYLEAFATSLITQKLVDANIEDEWYIKSLGSKESKNGRTYYDFKLVSEKC